jgi:hypothetical protein
VVPCLLAMDGSFNYNACIEAKDTVKMYILYFQHSEIGCGGCRLHDMKKRFASIAIFYSGIKSSQIIINQ